MIRSALLVLAALMFASCSQAQEKPQTGPELVRRRTVFVVNNTSQALILYISPTHQRIGYVGALKAGCLKIPQSSRGQTVIYARVYATNLRVFADPFSVESSAGWRWTVNQIQIESQIDLRPTRACGYKIT